MTWDGTGDGRCSFPQEQGVVWEGEPGSSSLNGSPGQLTWSLASHMRPLNLVLCAGRAWDQGSAILKLAFWQGDSGSVADGFRGERPEAGRPIWKV